MYDMGPHQMEFVTPFHQIQCYRQIKQELKLVTSIANYQDSVFVGEIIQK
ncbi:hypothetical protein HanXRQr2_Chr09g0386611 [Helianthus annuus]|uniref:Uncharacterized protein n=1 Tax=Helianthus annuus TaxID=4232 RepID=A0A9K3N853_HELAN|nr:hypothetical protein HanXRQr2_Chr09g0386611 [Helianthus annuus]KAJ0892999.1 hypothetical protein HanPSC8_Chr09g0372591 [Helianthus annuus]